jgi:protease-4
VQSAYVYREILRLRDQHPDKPVYAVIADTGASGAYYIAAAADHIYADQASLVGSIGVIMSGFGFTEAIDKLGVERRVMTAGSNKAVLDPFMPQEKDQQQHVQNMLDEIHLQFIAAVKQGRGERLVEGRDEEIFSGLFWTGEKALELGLIDGLGSPGQVSRDVIGVEEMVDYTSRRHPLEDLLGRFGTSIGQSMANALGGITLQ